MGSNRQVDRGLVEIIFDLFYKRRESDKHESSDWVYSFLVMISILTGVPRTFLVGLVILAVFFFVLSPTTSLIARLTFNNSVPSWLLTASLKVFIKAKVLPI